MDMQVMQKMIGEAMREKGFHSDFRSGRLRKEIGFRLLLIHTETSEFAQEIKRGMLDTDIHVESDVMEKLKKEVADGVIRYLDLAYLLDIDTDSAIREKMVENMGRPYRYGTADAKEKTS